MPRKPEFKPEITRVKLNPEQAVLVCDCYVVGKKVDASGIAVAVVCYMDGGNKLSGVWCPVGAAPKAVNGSTSS